MAGLINLIVNNIGKLIVLPILSLVIIGLTYFMSKNSDERIIKFYPSFIMGIVGLAISIIDIFSLTSAIGLNLVWIGIILLSNSLIGILFAGIIDLSNGVKDYYNQDKKVKKNGKK